MSRMARLLTVVLCGAVVTSAVVARAQEETKPINASITVGGILSDNRDSAPDGSEEDNLDIYARPLIQLMHEGEMTLLDLYYGPSYRWRSDPSQIQNEHEWHHDLNLTGRLKVTPNTTLRARERFNFTDDPDITGGGVNIRRDASYMMNRLYAGINQTMGERMNLDLVAHHMIKRYDDSDIADMYDEEVARAEFTARRKLTETFVGMGLIGAEMVSYEKIDDIERSYDSVFAGLGLAKQLGDRISVNALGGVQMADYDDGTIGSETVPIIRVGLDADVSESVSLTARGAHKLDNAYSFPYTSQRHTSVFANLAWRTSKVLTLSAFGEYRFEEYEADTVNPQLGVTSGDETTILAMATAAYKLMDKTTVALSYSIEDVDTSSPDVGATFTRNTGRVALTQEF